MTYRLYGVLHTIQGQLQESWHAQTALEAAGHSSVYLAGAVAGKILYRPLMLPMGTLALTTCLSYLAVKLALRHNLKVVERVQTSCCDFAKQHPYLRVSAIALAFLTGMIMPRIGLPLCCLVGVFNGIVLSQELNTRKLSIEERPAVLKR